MQIIFIINIELCRLNVIYGQTERKTERKTHDFAVIRLEFWRNMHYI